MLVSGVVARNLSVVRNAWSATTVYIALADEAKEEPQIILVGPAESNSSASNIIKLHQLLGMTGAGAFSIDGSFLTTRDFFIIDRVHICCLPGQYNELLSYTE